MPGRFITFEGGEGAGKSTQIARLRERLQARGFEVLATREPGGSARAERIRSLILAGGVKPLGPFAEAILFASARADHVRATIAPALARGAYVLCDRFVDSTRVYQGIVGSVDLGLVAALERLTADAIPDLTLVLDVPSSVGLARAERRRQERAEPQDRYEGEGGAYHDRIREGFLTIARGDPRRCAVIAADRPADEVEEAVWAEVEARLLPAPERKARRAREQAGG